MKKPTPHDPARDEDARRSGRAPSRAPTGRVSQELDALLTKCLDEGMEFVDVETGQTVTSNEELERISRTGSDKDGSE